MLVPELQKMSCRRGLYKICSVLCTPTTAWTLAPGSLAHAMLCSGLGLWVVFDGLDASSLLSLVWHLPELTPNCWFGLVVWGLNP